MEDFPWDAPVGRFMLAFGSIEHTTIALLGCLPDCRIPGNAPSLTLAQRIAILKEVLPRHAGNEYQATLAGLNKVSKLTTHRNFIAHNSVWFDIHQAGDKLVITNHLISTRDRTKRLSLDQVKALADEVHTAAHQFSLAAVDVMKNYMNDSERDPDRIGIR